MNENKKALTTKELNLLNGLLNREGVTGKRALRQFIYFNTYKPRYKLGDIVTFNALNNYCYGVAVKGFNGLVTEIKASYGGGVNDEKRIIYTIESLIINDDTKETHKNKYYVLENEILKKESHQKENRITPKNKSKESIIF